MYAGQTATTVPKKSTNESMKQAVPKEHNNQPAAARRCASSRMEVGPDEEVHLLEEDGQ